MVKKRPRDGTKYIVNKKQEVELQEFQGEEETEARGNIIVEVPMNIKSQKYLITQSIKNNNIRNWAIGFIAVLLSICAALLMIGKYYMQSF